MTEHRLSAAGKPHQRRYDRYGIYPKGAKSKGVGGGDDVPREDDRADDRDEKYEPDRKDDREEIDRGD